MHLLGYQVSWISAYIMKIIRGQCTSVMMSGLLGQCVTNEDSIVQSVHNEDRLHRSVCIYNEKRSQSQCSSNEYKEVSMHCLANKDRSQRSTFILPKFYVLV